VVGTYAYDALGRRISKTVGPVVTVFYYDNARIIESQETGGSGSVTTYTYGNYIDEVLTATRPAPLGALYYHQNTLWSVHALTDGTGAVVERYTYDAYGAITVLDPLYVPLSSAPVAYFTFTGREYDAETGLFHYRARTYGPGSGRFYSRDPLGYVDGMNLYQYVNGNPLTYVDPSGLWKVTRGRNKRAIVEAESNCDTYEHLSEIVGLDVRNIKKWLTPYKEEYNLVKGDSFTIPNTFIIGLGDMNGFAHWTVKSVANQVFSILYFKGYLVEYHDYRLAPFQADQLKDKDQYGMAFFGHGVSPTLSDWLTSIGGLTGFPSGLTGAICLWKDGWVIDDEDKSVLVYSTDYDYWSMGLFIGKFCWAKQGNWGNVVSANGKSWMGNRYELSGWTSGIPETARSVPGENQ
jgi:RHS repeat-associated protein